MKKAFVCFLACLVILSLVTSSAYAQYRRQMQQGAVTADLKVVSQKQTDTSNPAEVMVDILVQVTNKSKNPLTINNSGFVLVAGGQKYFVNRLAFTEVITIAPGESKQVSRIYFTVPRGTKPTALFLRSRGGVIGNCKL